VSWTRRTQVIEPSDLSLVDCVETVCGGTEDALDAPDPVDAAMWAAASAAAGPLIEARAPVPEQQARPIAMDVTVLLTPPCIFLYWFFIQNKQGGVIMTLTSTPSARAGARRWRRLAGRRRPPSAIPRPLVCAARR
jgi:hypothetical protein